MTSSKNQNGKTYYAQAGNFEIHEKDSSLGYQTKVEEGYISGGPHRIDTTDYGEMERMREVWEK